MKSVLFTIQERGEPSELNVESRLIPPVTLEPAIFASPSAPRNEIKLTPDKHISPAPELNQESQE